MRDPKDSPSLAEEVWRKYLTTGDYEKERRQRTFLSDCRVPNVVKIALHPFAAPAACWSNIFITKYPQT